MEKGDHGSEESSTRHRGPSGKDIRRGHGLAVPRAGRMDHPIDKGQKNDQTQGADGLSISGLADHGGHVGLYFLLPVSHFLEKTPGVKPGLLILYPLPGCLKWIAS